MIKRSIHQEDIMILNANAPNNRASKHTEQKLTKLERERGQLHDYSWGITAG